MAVAHKDLGLVMGQDGLGGIQGCAVPYTMQCKTLEVGVHAAHLVQTTTDPRGSRGHPLLARLLANNKS